DSAAPLLRGAAAGEVRMSARPGSLPTDRLPATLSSDDGARSALRGQNGPADCRGEQKGEGGSAWLPVSTAAGWGLVSLKQEVCEFFQEAFRPYHRNTDIWLERGCHLAAVALSVPTAFLLRFDLAVPAGVIPILKEALLLAILVKLPVFHWIGFYRGLR